MIDFKGSQFEREIVLWGVRWYVAYPISYRQLVRHEVQQTAVMTQWT
jgi:transposase-like protein